MTNDILNYFKDTGAMLEGHFILSSGLHSEKYIQCALLLQYPQIAKIAGQKIAENFKNQGITCVAGPAMGGIIVAYTVAEALGVKTVFGERENGNMCLRRGFTLTKDDNVLVVEDVITTGKSVKELIDVINRYESRIAGVASIVDRSEGKAGIGYPVCGLVQIKIDTYDPHECPLCKKGIPAVKPGSRGLK